MQVQALEFALGWRSMLVLCLFAWMVTRSAVTWGHGGGYRSEAGRDRQGACRVSDRACVTRTPPETLPRRVGRRRRRRREGGRRDSKPPHTLPASPSVNPSTDGLIACAQPISPYPSATVAPPRARNPPTLPAHTRTHIMRLHPPFPRPAPVTVGTENAQSDMKNFGSKACCEECLRGAPERGTAKQAAFQFRADALMTRAQIVRVPS